MMPATHRKEMPIIMKIVRTTELVDFIIYSVIKKKEERESKSLGETEQTTSPKDYLNVHYSPDGTASKLLHQILWLHLQTIH